MVQREIASMTIRSEAVPLDCAVNDEVLTPLRGHPPVVRISRMVAAQRGLGVRRIQGLPHCQRA